MYKKRDPVEKVMKSGVLSYGSAWRPGGGVVNDASGHNMDQKPEHIHTLHHHLINTVRAKI